MGKSSAPPAPDYAAAAVAQGDANRETAQYNTGANRINQYGPQGSSEWTIRPGADPDNPQPGDYIQTTSLSPEQQRQYDEGNRITEALLATAGQQLGRVSDTFNTPIDFSSLPAWRTSGQGGNQPAANVSIPGVQGGSYGGGGGVGGGMASPMPMPKQGSINSAFAAGPGGQQPSLAGKEALLAAMMQAGAGR